MRKLILLSLLCLLLVGCNLPSSQKKSSSIKVDYETAEDFETALNSGIDGNGKVVTFTVTDFKPDSAFGYNLITGEHLNFCSSSHAGSCSDTHREESVDRFKCSGD